jgi:hypothetical protein
VDLEVWEHQEMPQAEAAAVPVVPVAREQRHWAPRRKLVVQVALESVQLLLAFLGFMLLAVAVV